MRALVVLALSVIAACGCGRNEEPSAKPKGPTGGASGSGGTGGSGVTGGGGSNGGLLDVARVLDGFVLKQPCLEASGTRACRTEPPGACPVTEDPAVTGAKPTDETLTFGGESGVLYDVTLHVQGIVESKAYRGGADASNLVTNGFQRSGTVDNTMSQHSVFALHVTAPTGYYFWNSLGKDATHSTFPVDYEATITIQGGTPLELWISDPNCVALRNCADPDVPSECTPVDLPDLDPKIAQSLGSAPAAYDGQFLGFVVTNVVRR